MNEQTSRSRQQSAQFLLIFSSLSKLPLITCCQCVPEICALISQKVRFQSWKSNQSNLCLKWEKYLKNSKTIIGSFGGQDLNWKERKETLWPQICSGSTKIPQHPSIREALKQHSLLLYNVFSLSVTLDLDFLIPSELICGHNVSFISFTFQILSVVCSLIRTQYRVVYFSVL